MSYHRIASGKVARPWPASLCIWGRSDVLLRTHDVRQIRRVRFWGGGGTRDGEQRRYCMQLAGALPTLIPRGQVVGTSPASNGRISRAISSDMSPL
jgi:hypothetical protein